MNTPFDIVIYQNIKDKTYTILYEPEDVYSVFFIRHYKPIILLHRFFNISQNRNQDEEGKLGTIPSVFTSITHVNKKLDNLVKDRIRTTIMYADELKDNTVYYLRTNIYYKNEQIPYNKICRMMIGDFKYIDTRITLFKAPVYYNETALPNEIFLYNNDNKLVFVLNTLQKDVYSYYDLKLNIIKLSEFYMIKVTQEGALKDYLALSSFLSLLKNVNIIIINDYKFTMLYNYFRSYAYTNILIRTKMKDTHFKIINLCKLRMLILKNIVKLVLENKKIDDKVRKFFKKIEGKIPMQNTVVRVNVFNEINSKMFNNTLQLGERQIIRTSSYIQQFLLNYLKKMGYDKSSTIIQFLFEKLNLKYPKETLKQYNQQVESYEKELLNIATKVANQV